MTVELFGLPGSGKTTLVESVSRNLVSTGYSALSRSDINSWFHVQPWHKKFSFFFQNAHRFSATFFSGIFLALSARPFRKDSLVRVFRVQKTIISRDFFYRKNKPDSLLIMDQSEIQEIWSLLALSNRYKRNLLELYIKNILQCDSRCRVYVYLRASASLASERVSMRQNGGSRFENVDKHTRQAIFLNSMNVFETIASVLRQEGRLLIDLDSREELAECVDIVVSAIEHAKR